MDIEKGKNFFFFFWGGGGVMCILGHDTREHLVDRLVLRTFTVCLDAEISTKEVWNRIEHRA